MSDQLSAIGFDAKRALSNATGLGNYSRFVLNAVAQASPASRLVLFAPKADPGRMARIADFAALPQVSLITPHTPMQRRLSGLWRISGIAGDIRRADLSVFHGLSNELPLTIRRAATPSVVTIHDLIWRRIPGDYAFVDRKLYDLKYGRSARNADRIIAISRCTARDIVNDFGVDPDKIDFIYQGCDPAFVPATDTDIARVRKKYRLGDNPYIVAVGTVQSRKNQLLALKSLRGIDADVRLVIVGRHTSYARRLYEYLNRHPELAGRVTFVTDAPFGDLPALYSGAILSAYPSRYEGFGLPVIESLACHTPVIAATGSCLEEAGGDGALYVDPDDDEAFALQASNIICDDALRTQLISNGTKHIAQFNPETFARLTLDSYRRAISTHNNT